MDTPRHSTGVCLSDQSVPKHQDQQDQPEQVTDARIHRDFAGVH